MSIYPFMSFVKYLANIWLLFDLNIIIFVLFPGMAILSMCFSLIQEEIVAKFKWVGEKIGKVTLDL